MPMVMQAKPINHQRVKSPIVHIDLRSCKEETKHSRYAVDNTSGEEEEEDNIASMPEIINDSMMGELNMLISDLNNGKNKSSGRQHVRQLSSNRNKFEPTSPPDTDVVVEDFDKQAKALYFDLGPAASNDLKSNMTTNAKTVDYIEGEYTASAVRKSGPNGRMPTTNQSEKTESAQSNKRMNKQKYIEQSVKAAAIQQNIMAVQSNSSSNPILQSATREVRDRSRDISQPKSIRVKTVVDLNLDQINLNNNNNNSSSGPHFDLLYSDRSNKEPPTQEENQKPNDSPGGVPELTLESLNKNNNQKA